MLLLAGFAVYANSLSGPFVFDDVFSIPKNPSIRHFATAFFPPDGGQTVTGRPVLNLSFALNYAISGTYVWSYHLLNLVIHLAAGLTLFGIVRRTLELVGWPGVPGPGAATVAKPARAASESARALAFAVALLWIVHPLQTEAVTYVVQRAESLMGLFYLLTLYCFIRGTTTATDCMAGSPGPAASDGRAPAKRDREIPPHRVGKSIAGQRGLVVPWSPGPSFWYVLSIVVCLLGMGTKEVMVSAPVMVFLYDRTYVSGSFREAWRRRRGWHLSLAATWIPLAVLVMLASDRGGTAGFGIGVGFLQYAVTQFGALAHYLRLVVWPYPLIIDYGARWVTSIPDVAPFAAVVSVVVALTLVSLWRRPRLGYLGAWFLAILAPTSLVPGARQTMAEHRMYLALAPALVLLVLGLHALVGRRGRVAFFAAVAGLGAMTLQRNHDYRSRLALWTQTVAHRPNNPFPHINLGNALLDLSQPERALKQFDAAVRLDPNNADAYYDAGNALARLGRLPEAIGHYQASIQLRPNAFDAHNNLADVLVRAGRIPEAVKQYEAVVWLQPRSFQAHYNLGDAFHRAGRNREAIQQLQTALRLRPDFADAHNNLGIIYAEGGHLDEAAAQYQAALRSEPNNVQAHQNLGMALLRLGRVDAARAQFVAVLRLQPDSPVAAYNLGTIYQHLGQVAEAKAQFETVVRLQPGNSAAHNNLGNILARSGQIAEAIDQYRAALRAEPSNVVAHFNLGTALEESGQADEARAQFEAVLRLKPDFAPARAALASLAAGTTGAH